ncbi:uncharacterized protein LOC124170350 isoform X2 [Ischnura elegans]|uniref:uncharacterized protein LOC124170350 isoform X2 n=1 Tax=Ischnura elegans TaxID=197161 RepID=UPI001ED880C9|nr:uncharacterized protein LOC124170350 isoform X2 [Ischnura elegans]
MSVLGGFAVVRYISDNVVEVVPTTHIENFSRDEFDVQTVYWVKYKVVVDRHPESAESSTDEEDSHQAVILKIYEDKEDAEKYRLIYLRSEKRLTKPVIRYYMPRKRKADADRREVTGKASRKVKQDLSEASRNIAASRMKALNKILQEKEETLKARRKDSRNEADDRRVNSPAADCQECQGKAWQVELLEKEVAALTAENKILKDYNDSLKETNKVLQEVVGQMCSAKQTGILEVARDNEAVVTVERIESPKCSAATSVTPVALNGGSLDMELEVENLAVDFIGEAGVVGDVEYEESGGLLQTAGGMEEPIWAETNGKVHWGWGQWVPKSASNAVLAQIKLKRVAGDATRVLLGREAEKYNYTGYRSANGDTRNPPKKPFPDCIKKAVEAVMLKWCEITQQPENVIRDIRMCPASQGYKAAMTQVGITMAKSKIPGFAEKKKQERMRRLEKATNK